MKLKMNLIVLVILFAVALYGVNCLESSDLCNLVDKECTGRYTGNSLGIKYETICEFEKCHMPYQYKCEF